MNGKITRTLFELGDMTDLDPESIEAVRLRLIALRLAVEPNSSAFARRMGMSPQQWANYESPANMRRITIDSALLLCRKFGVTLEWIYRGHEHMMPHALLETIQRQDVKRSRKVG